MTRHVFWSIPLVAALASSAAAQVGNTRLGTNAGESVTTGDYDTFVGERAGQNGTAMSYGTFVGYGAGRWQTTASDNVCIGFGAGAGGTFVETDPLPGDPIPTTSGTDNTFVGARAGLLNTATDNTFMGTQAGMDNTTGFDNTFIGEESGYNNTIGHDNTFVGEDSAYTNTTGNDNTVLGSAALRMNDTGNGNTAVGSEALYDVTTAHMNTGVGAYAGVDIGAGLCNTMLGAKAGVSTEYGDYNTFVGFLAGGDNNRTNATNNANLNTYVGTGAGYGNREGIENVVLGALSDFANNRDTTDAELVDECNYNNGFANGNLSAITGGHDRSVLVGARIWSNANDAVTLGYRARASANTTITLGANATTTHAGAVTIGYGATSHAANTVVVGNDTTVSWDPNADGATALGSAAYRFSQAYSQAYTALAATGTDATVTLSADNGTDMDDHWSVSAANSGDFTISSMASGTFSPLLAVANTGDVTIAGDLTLNSDERLKEALAPIHNALDLACSVEGITYYWRPELRRDTDLHYGVSAQQVQEVLPELVSQGKDGVLSVNYVGFVPILLSATHQLKDQVDHERSERTRLEGELAAQKAQLEDLRQQMAAQRQALAQLTAMARKQALAR